MLCVHLVPWRRPNDCSVPLHGVQPRRARRTPHPRRPCRSLPPREPRRSLRASWPRRSSRQPPLREPLVMPFVVPLKRHVGAIFAHQTTVCGWQRRTVAFGRCPALLFVSIRKHTPSVGYLRIWRRYTLAARGRDWREIFSLTEHPVSVLRLLGWRCHHDDLDITFGDRSRDLVLGNPVGSLKGIRKNLPRS